MAKRYGTEIMKDEECFLFLEAATENNTSIIEAIQDMRMIDNMLLAKRNHILVFGTIKTTQRGYFRKDSKLFNVFDNIITARANKIDM